MRAVVVRSFGEPVAVIDMPAHEPGPGQVRIRVAAAAVNPVDAATWAGLMGQARPGVIGPREYTGLGWDLAGTVVAVGSEGTGITPGDAVIGLRDRLDGPAGTFADEVVLDAGDVAPAPSGVDPVPASTIPLNGLTALQALDALAAAGLRAGHTILVTGRPAAWEGSASNSPRCAGCG